MRNEIAAFCVCLLGLSSACSDADILLGWRKRLGSAGTGAFETDAGSGGLASAGRAGAASVGVVQVSTGGLAGVGGAMPTAGTAAADGGTDAGSRPGSQGCGADAPTAAMGTIQVAGKSANYLVDLPLGYDKARPYPLLFAFRGSSDTVDQLRTNLALAQAVGSDALVVYPDSVASGSDLTWDVQRDLPLFDTLLTQTGMRYCVDERRAFAVGHELGAYFADALGCLRADKLRGVAAFSPGVPPMGTCQGDVAVLIAQGTTEVPIALTNGRNTMQFWAKRNGCDASKTSGVDPSPCVELSTCDPGFAVRYCEYAGGIELPPFAATGVWSFFKSL